MTGQRKWPNAKERRRRARAVNRLRRAKFKRKVAAWRLAREARS